MNENINTILEECVKITAKRTGKELKLVYMGNILKIKINNNEESYYITARYGVSSDSHIVDIIKAALNTCKY